MQKLASQGVLNAHEPMKNMTAQRRSRRSLHTSQQRVGEVAFTVLLVPTQEVVQKAHRSTFAADVAGVPTIVLARYRRKRSGPPLTSDSDATTHLS